MTGLMITVCHVGVECEPVVVVDNMVPEPGRLRKDSEACIFLPGDNHYPGVKAPVHNEYLSGIWPVLSPIFKDIFGISGKISLLDLTYALVAQAPAALTLEQRIPHVDALLPGRLALIHYLVPTGTEGTAFFRHRSTGFETIDHVRSAAYFTQLAKDLQCHGQPVHAYPGGDTPIFEQTRYFDGYYNRALIYRSRLLHSGAIGPDSILSADPRIGRLTITGFFATG